MSPNTRSSAKAAAEAGSSASQGQSIAPSSAAADINRPVTSADLLQFFQQMREEDNHRRDEENEENRRRDEQNRIFQEQSLSFQKLLMDRFGPSPANTSSQPSPISSLGTQVEVYTAKPSASSGVIDVPDVPDVHAAPASNTTTSRPASLATLSAEADCQVKEEEESCQHLAEVQVVAVESSVTARLTTIEANIEDPAPAHVAQTVLAVMTARSLVKEREDCGTVNSRDKFHILHKISAFAEYVVRQTFLSLVPTANIPYTHTDTCTTTTI
ncbi:MAG: hypothetical protein SEPTF4163_003628 [Sporothrix epigloea]